MSYYQVLLGGEDFLLNLSSGLKKGGFATTRWVKASSPEEAELKAVELVKNDAGLLEITKNNHDKSPMIYLEELSKVSWFAYIKRKPGKGYTFFTE